MGRSYNGFSVSERTRLSKIQDDELRSNPWARVTACAACAVDTGIVQHLEDYAKPLDITGLCHRCHTMLHERFDYPEAFDRYCKAIRDGFTFPVPNPRSHWREVANGMCRSQSGFAAAKLTRPARESTVLDDILSGDHESATSRGMATLFEGI